MRRSLIWVKPGGAELADLELTDVDLAASGRAIGSEPLPYYLEYELTTSADFVTRRLAARASGSEPSRWSRSLDLSRNADGTWTIEASAQGDAALPPPGGDVSAIEGALDIDLGLSPLANSMPVLRHRLTAGGGPVDFLMAWVSVPDLAVDPSRQRYEHVRDEAGHAIIRFSSDNFVEEIVFDRDGLVVDYPSIGTQPRTK